MRKRTVRRLCVFYFAALFYTVFLTPNRYLHGHSAKVNYIPVTGTIQRFYEQAGQPYWTFYIEYWGNIFGNIILFMPLGFLYKCLYPSAGFFRICLVACLVSTCIEIIQFTLQVGVCDIDDVILNGLGAMAGIAVYLVLKNRKPEWFTGV